MPAPEELSRDELIELVGERDARIAGQDALRPETLTPAQARERFGGAAKQRAEELFAR